MLRSTQALVTLSALLSGVVLAGQEPVRMSGGTRSLGAEQLLDLDTGGVFLPSLQLPGLRAEIAATERGLVPLVPSEPAPEVDACMPRIAPAPWLAVRTDQGRAAWVQMLPGAVPPAVRFLVASRGTVFLPPVGNARAVGGDGAIAVWFEPAERYATYQIERGAAPGFEPAPLASVPGSPFVDKGAVAGQRYVYRITGIAADGGQGVPVTIAATTESAGVRMGRVRVHTGQSVDLLAERVVDSGGDLGVESALAGQTRITLPGGWQVQVKGGGADRQGSYLPQATGQPPALVGGCSFSCPLRGAGVARCRLARPAGITQDAVDIEFEAYPDSELLPEEPALACEFDVREVRVWVRSAPGFPVRKVAVSDPESQKELGELPVVRGLARDGGVREGQLREYRAVGVDGQGRRGVVAVRRFHAVPPGWVSGTFQLRGEQGFSFAKRALASAEEADVVLVPDPKRESSFTLNARGIVTLQDVLSRAQGAPRTGSAVELWASVVSARGDQLPLRPEATGDGSAPASDVFLLRTRSGGWAKLAISERETAGPGGLVTVRYVFNPKESVFAPSDGAETVGPLLWNADAAEAVAPASGTGRPK